MSFFFFYLKQEIRLHSSLRYNWSWVLFPCLGLHMSHSCVRRHGGAVECHVAGVRRWHSYRPSQFHHMTTNLQFMSHKYYRYYENDSLNRIFADSLQWDASDHENVLCSTGRHLLVIVTEINVFLSKEPKCFTFADLFCSDKQLSEAAVRATPLNW